MPNPEEPNPVSEDARTLRPQPARESNSRKKACEACSVAKVRCDHKKPRCTRCESRKINCDYAASPRYSSQPVDRGGLCLPGTYITPEYVVDNRSMGMSSQNTPNSNDSDFITSASTVLNGPGNALRTQAQDAQPSRYWPGQALDFESIDLICTIDSTKIGNRWLGDFIPTFDRRVKNSPPSIVLFISRVLKTYPAILLRSGHLPPFIHPSQLSGPEMPTPLANCLSLVQMWDGQVRGSENMVRRIIRNEMSRLYEERQSYIGMNQLAAFQAYLIYALVLFFADDQSGQLIDRQIMINLQDFACNIASSGLVCPAELSHQRPDWESWIVATTKLRSLYTMYLLDNVFCSLNGLPTYLGEELESLSAPASKTLWEASCRAVWEADYDKHLTDWPGGALRIDELWPAPETGSEERRNRVDKWLGSVDEFGMMLFAVTLVTHGG